MNQNLFKPYLYGLISKDQNEDPRLARYGDHIESILQHTKETSILGDVFSAMLHLTTELEWEGACHKTASILYVLYRELGFQVDLCLGEVKIDHRYFDHSWIQIDGQILDASLISPLQKDLHLAPVFMDIDLNTMKKTHLQYGVSSTIGLNEFTKHIYHRPFHKYMNPTPFGKGKWRYVEAINNALDLHINIGELPEKYKHTERLLVFGNNK